MRASENDKHISGAERIVSKDKINKVIKNLIGRPFLSKNGNADFVNVKIEKLKTKPIIIDCLNHKYIEAFTKEETYHFLKDQFNSHKIPNLERILAIFNKHKSLNGAIILNPFTLETFDTIENPVRATLIDSIPLKISNKKDYYREAITLATKVANVPYIIGELCVSDDIYYPLGYLVLNKECFNILFNLKDYGVSGGCRIFFTNATNESEMKILKHYLTEIPFLVKNIGKMTKEDKQIKRKCFTHNKKDDINEFQTFLDKSNFGYDLDLTSLKHNFLETFK